MDLWRSPLHGRTFVQIEKRLLHPQLDAEQTAGLPPDQVFAPLPEEVKKLLGLDVVDYDSFTAAYPPEEKVKSLFAKVRQHGLLHLTGIDRRVELPWHAFEAGDSRNRTLPELTAALKVEPLSGLYLVQFAYPLHGDWLTAFTDCGVRQIAFFQQRTLLVKAPSLARLLDCKSAPYFSWIGPYLTVDRVSPELATVESPMGYELQYIAGTDLVQKSQGLPESLVVEQVSEISVSESAPAAFLHVKGTLKAFRQLVEQDPDLLSVTHRGEADWSDERQGQIVAGNHNGTAVTTPGYRNWLSARGLLTPANQQTVCVVDLGYDDGGAPTAAVDHHPDLENPERLVVGIADIHFTGQPEDINGHGTMVAGIIAGEGVSGLGTGEKDANGYLYGSGIAPSAKLAVAKIISLLQQSHHQNAFNFCRNNPDGSDRALIVNESWNENRPPDGASPYWRPMSEYTSLARFFDERVINANSALSSLEAMTIVFSAGNHAYDLGTGTIRRDSVSSPALAKNVIAVGATASYRPVPVPPLDCNEQADGSRPTNQDALHIGRIGNFSGRGKSFSATTTDKVHMVRIKPDLVAPGIRVFSTIPYQYTPYGVTPVNGCTRAYPNNVNSNYTYGTGTSFAAPVVTAVAALKLKWFGDRGTPRPSPSLIKASLIATSDNLGASGLVGNDHRPSPNYGWGRVNLDRLTDSRDRFYVTDNQGLSVSTGQQRTWTRTIGDSSSDIYIVLAWSDSPSDVTGNSQVSLKNDLSLAVDEPSTTRSWRGNNFRENVVGDDNGYSYRFSAGEASLVDTKNNVEAIFIPAGTLSPGQQLTIKVTGQSVSTGTQKFAVYAYNVK
jgi:subtilisin family serine protease